MESPPSSSTWSEAFILSDDSGLLLTNGSASSGSISGDGKVRRRYIAFEDSDCEKSLSQDDDSLDGMSDIMCGENFNTLKKGPQVLLTTKHSSSPIDPPPEFQDKPPKFPLIEIFYEKLTNQIIRRAIFEYKENFCRKLRIPHYRSLHYILARPCISNEFMPLSPCHIVGRPSSRSSLGSSRLSSSHNSLSVPTAHKVDDSTFITQAVSHDALSTNFISDLYNVPFDSDVYAVPVDTLKPPLKPKRNFHQHKKKRRNTASGCREIETRQSRIMTCKRSIARFETSETKRHSVAGTSAGSEGEPIHMTLQEVRQYLQTLYSSSSESSDHQEKNHKPKSAVLVRNNNKYSFANSDLNMNKEMMNNNNKRSKKNTFLINIKNKKVKDSCDNLGSKQIKNAMSLKEEKRKKSPAKLLSFKQALCNLFKFKKLFSPESIKRDNGDKRFGSSGSILDETHNNISSRALPPLPNTTTEEHEISNDEQILDFATSIQRVKDYGWYWGPISSEAAEKILSNEPDGSFIVRDSSDDHYIFSLTFKLNNCVRHVRIEHDQGNFSFGSCTKFKSQTIVEFIENAVEHSRSGRYLFFLHRRPVIGPVRVQLLHPVSRFKQVQSLQHICRFVIHKHLRRDLIPSLPLPRRLIDYLNTPHYYSEHFVDVSDSSEEQQQQQLPNEMGAMRRSPPSDNFNAETSAPINNYVVMNNNADIGQS